MPTYPTDVFSTTSAPWKPFFVSQQTQFEVVDAGPVDEINYLVPVCTLNVPTNIAPEFLLACALYMNGMDTAFYTCVLTLFLQNQPLLTTTIVPSIGPAAQSVLVSSPPGPQSFCVPQFDSQPSLASMFQNVEQESGNPYPGEYAIFNWNFPNQNSPQGYSPLQNNSVWARGKRVKSQVDKITLSIPPGLGQSSAALSSDVCVGLGLAAWAF